MSIIDYHVRVVVEGPTQHYFRIIQTDVVDETVKETGNEAEVHRDFAVELNESTVPTATSALLAITTNVGSVIVDDVTNITADPDDTKFVQISVVRKDSDSVLSILAEEKVLGNYAGVPSGYELEQIINEFSVVAAGTALVEV